MVPLQVVLVLFEVMLDETIFSLKVMVKVPETEKPLAPSAGLDEATVGAVVSEVGV